MPFDTVSLWYIYGMPHLKNHLFTTPHGQPSFLEQHSIKLPQGHPVSFPPSRVDMVRYRGSR